MPITPESKHYVVAAVDMPPMRLVCKCGAITEGVDCIETMTIHITEGNSE